MNIVLHLLSPPTILADMTLAPFILSGAILGAIACTIVLATEAIVFKRLGWTWEKAFVDAFLLNLISTVAGCFIYPIMVFLVTLLLDNIKLSESSEDTIFFQLLGL
jgi:hypothetical protein